MPSTDTATKRMDREEWNRLEQIIERFEEAWQDGQRPAIDDFVKAEVLAPRTLLLELVHAELECRLKAGEAVLVETYFERYPQIGDDREEVLELIAAEYKFRQRREPNLTPADYERRFPQYRPELPARLLPLRPRERFPTHLSCPHCHKSIPVSESAGEKQLTCSSCGGSFRFDLAHAPAWSPQALPWLGPFELLNEIGQGAFGTVYRARDANLGRIVAIKVPRIGRWVTPADQDRFLREARNAARLAHPGIVPVYEVGRGAPVPYLVSAFVQGITLAKVLADRRFGFREAAEVIAQVAEALDHAHQHGVIHRDLKPSNIMLGRLEGAACEAKEAASVAPPSAPVATLPANGTGSRAFVMDFGLSRREEGEITVTIEGQILGTPAYMSPEQARGEAHHVDGRSDVYCLGVILYEMLTGEIPFRGVTRMVLQQIQLEDPRPPRRLNDKLPRDLETITLKCMAKEANRRYQTAGELAADLRRHLNGLPIQARPLSRLERFWRWCKRNPRVAGLLGLVVGLITIVIVGSLAAMIVISWERDLARENAITANERLDLAIGTLSTLVFEVDEQLTDRPAVHKLKEGLLKKAIDGLDRVIQTKRFDATDSMTAAYERLGDAYISLGKLAAARESWERSRSLREAMLATNPDKNHVLRSRLCATYGRLGRVAFRLMDFEACREYFSKAFELAQAAADHVQPPSAELLFLLSICHTDHGNLKRETGEPQAALRDYAAAQELLRVALNAVEEDNPEKFRGRCRLAELHVQRGEAFRMIYDGKVMRGEILIPVDDLEAARAEFGKALELQEALLRVKPESRRLQRDLAFPHERLVAINYRLNNPAEGLRHATQCLALREQFVKTDPEDTHFQGDLATAYMYLGMVYSQMGNARTSRDHYVRSLEIARRVVAAESDDIQFRASRLGSLYLNLGINEELNLRDYEAAVKWYQVGLDLLQPFEAQGKIKEQPQLLDLLAQMRRKLRICRAAGQAIDNLAFALAQPPADAAALLFIRAAVLADRGQHVAAAEAAEKLRTLDPKSIAFLYDAACGYALCVAGVGQGKPAQQRTSEETAARKHYAGCAIAILATVEQLGFKNASRIEVDTDFAAIRQEEGYRELIARLKTSPKQRYGP